jgi:hypothetical protein
MRITNEMIFKNAEEKCREAKFKGQVNRAGQDINR